MKNFDPTNVENFVVMSQSQVRRFDAWAINELGIPGIVLMENASCSCAELIIAKLSNTENAKVGIFCGTGNNGGDGYVIARHLAGAGIATGVLICGDKSKVKGDALTNLNIIEGLKLPIAQLEMTPGRITEQVAEFARGSDILADALFGTGLKGKLDAGYTELISAVNTCNLPVVAVDIPSGLDCDTGLPLGEAIKAIDTVTFVAVKKGFVANAKSFNYTGQVHIASIGVEPAAAPANL